MHPHVVGRRRWRPLTRQFERSHWEPQLIASAYECACPIARRTLTSRTQPSTKPQRARPRAAAHVAWGG
jgi:hypothetical protein